MPDLFTLFWICLQVGLFTFGGGAAMMPLISRNLIDAGFLTVRETQDMVSIAQMTPGPFAVNAGTFAGMKLGGLPGALLATMGVALPAALIALLLARFFFPVYKKPLVSGFLSGIRPVALATIVGFVWFFARDALRTDTGAFDLPAIGIMLPVFLLNLRTKTSPALLLTVSAGLGIVLM